jgi:hypothetical protein
MTDREWARMCIRGGFGCLALVLACALAWWAGMAFWEWVKG